MSPVAVHAEGLGKRYRIGQRRPYARLGETLADTLRRSARRPTRSPHEDADELWALRDVSFEVGEGEVLGIIGPNGAGKSTLLKILSRITEPTEGWAVIGGQVRSLLEVGTGFHPELTGRENVYLNGAILGMRRAELKRKLDEIVAFAEIERFLDTPVKRYSSGMYVRLAFAVAAHLDPEILIVDEVLAVGDAAFQRKCLGKMGEVGREGRAVLFVSHNMTAVKALCDRALLLQGGRILKGGPTDRVVAAYLEPSLGASRDHVAFPEDTRLRIQVLEAGLLPTGEKSDSDLIFRCTYRVQRPLPDVLLCAEVRNSADISVFYANDALLEDDRKRALGIHTVTLIIPCHLLAPGEYSVAFGFWEPGRRAEHFPHERLLFRREEPITRLASHGMSWPSVTYLPGTWSYVESRNRRLQELSR